MYISRSACWWCICLCIIISIPSLFCRQPIKAEVAAWLRKHRFADIRQKINIFPISARVSTPLPCPLAFFPVPRLPSPVSAETLTKSILFCESRYESERERERGREEELSDR